MKDEGKQLRHLVPLLLLPPSSFRLSPAEIDAEVERMRSLPDVADAWIE